MTNNEKREKLERQISKLYEHMRERDKWISKIAKRNDRTNRLQRDLYRRLEMIDDWNCKCTDCKRRREDV